MAIEKITIDLKIDRTLLRSQIEDIGLIAEDCTDTKQFDTLQGVMNLLDEIIYQCKEETK